MAASTRHIIQRQTVWLDSPGSPPSFEVQERVSAYCRNQLPTLLESLFDRYIDAETIIRIDQLNVNVGQLSVTNLEEALTGQLTKQIERALGQLNGAQSPSPFEADEQPLLGKFERFTRDEHLGEQIRYFLLNGYLPAWVHSSDFEKNTHWLTTPSALLFRQELRKMAGEHPSRLSRLIHHCPDLTILWIATESGDTNQVKTIQWLLGVSQEVTGLPYAGLREQFWQLALKNALTGNDNLEVSQATFVSGLLSKAATTNLIGRLLHALEKLVNKAQPSEVIPLHLLQNLLRQLESEQAHRTQKASFTDASKTNRSDNVRLQESHRQDFVKGEEGEEQSASAQKHIRGDERRGADGKTQDDQTPDPTTETPHGSHNEELFVPLAGIVLLHPFLVEVFSEMGLLLNRRQWVNEQATIKGVQMLAYLATGNDFCPEFDMPLLKLLCGMPLEAVVTPDLALTAIDRRLAAELLEAVIQHWSALGNISPDGLREAFLQREGKLLATDAGWRLTVERKTLDILLSRLPWGYSLIKLPFMPTMLYVDWT